MRATPFVWVRYVSPPLCYRSHEISSHGLSTTNDLFNWHILEVTKLLIELTICMNLGGTTQRNFLTIEISSTLSPNKQMLLTIFVNFMTNSSIESLSFMRITLNSLFKVNTFASLTRSIPQALFAVSLTLPLPSSSLPTWEERPLGLLGRWRQESSCSYAPHRHYHAQDVLNGVPHVLCM